jgi:hypothetical protein
MFPLPAFLFPGQEVRHFTVTRTGTRETPNGRELSDGTAIERGEIQAVLAQASPREIEQWRQLQHPITHKIIEQGVSGFDILPGDAFHLGNRSFVNQSMPYNVGDIDHWTIYYCQERKDV